MVGAARLTAHGSAGAALLGGAAAAEVAPRAGGAVIEAVAVAVVACGVLATVESPEPQPVNVAATNTTAARPSAGPARQGSHPTTRTVPPSGRQVRQAWPSLARANVRHTRCVAVAKHAPSRTAAAARNYCSNPSRDRLESPSRREDVKGQRDSALNAQNHGESAFDLAHRVGRQRSQSFQQAGAGDGTHAAADGDARGVHTFVR